MARQPSRNSFDYLRRLCDADESDDGEPGSDVDDDREDDGDYLPDDDEQDDDDDVMSDAVDDPEFSGDDDDGSQDDADVAADENIDGDVLVGKNGMVWDHEPPDQAGRRRARDVIRQARGLKNCENINSADQAFGAFLTDDIVMIIVRCTNQLARAVYQRYNDGHPDDKMYWKPVDEMECKAFLGLLILAGVFRSNHECLDELWSEEDGRAVFRSTMSLKRFQALMRFCRFDDRNTRAGRARDDKLAAIRDVWEMFQATLRSHYKPGPYLTIDEQLCPFRGRCSFRQYMSSKPAKYGIKLWWMCDAETTYPLVGQVYLGKAENQQREQNQGTRVVKDLISPYYNSGRNVTTDNFFTSIPLADDLLQQNLTIVGTLRSNKPHIPPQMKADNAREVESSIFGFSEEKTLVSYVPKKKKAVNLLSTLHHDASVPEENNPRKKPEIVLFYNSTKGGVDNLDKLVGTYSCRRKINRWPMCLFFNMVDIAAVAAMIVWITKYPDWKVNKKTRRRSFLRELGMRLTAEYIEQRLANPRAIQKGVRSGLKLLGYDVGRNARNADQPAAKRRCVVCPRAIDRKTRAFCEVCGQNVCKEHSSKNLICVDCQADIQQ